MYSFQAYQDNFIFFVQREWLNVSFDPNYKKNDSFVRLLISSS